MTRGIGRGVEVSACTFLDVCGFFSHVVWKMAPEWWPQQCHAFRRTQIFEAAQQKEGRQEVPLSDRKCHSKIWPKALRPSKNLFDRRMMVQFLSLHRAQLHQKLPFVWLRRHRALGKGDINVVHYCPEITHHYVIMSYFSALHKRPWTEEKPPKRSLASADTHTRWRQPLTFSRSAPFLRRYRLIPRLISLSASLCNAHGRYCRFSRTCTADAAQNAREVARSWQVWKKEEENSVNIEHQELMGYMGPPRWSN